MRRSLVSRKIRPIVKNAVSDLKVAYPIPIDSSHSIRSAFHNEYWPADYFIDRRGRIRYHHFGEGEYEKSERVIQELLREGGAAGLNADLVRINAAGAGASPSDDVRSPEIDVGYARAENFASPERIVRSSRKPTGEVCVESVGTRRIVERRRRERHTRIGTRKNCVQISQPRPPYGSGAGKTWDACSFQGEVGWHGARCPSWIDSGADGPGKIQQPRMYQLIRQMGSIKDVTFEIEFLDPGVEVFSFTFG